MKSLKQPFLIALLLIAAFLFGKYFSEAQEEQTVLKEDPPRVYIEQLKTKMNIRKNRNDIEIFLNGERMTDDIKIDVKR